MIFKFFQLIEKMLETLDVDGMKEKRKLETVSKKIKKSKFMKEPTIQNTTEGLYSLKIKESKSGGMFDQVVKRAVLENQKKKLRLAEEEAKKKRSQEKDN